MVTYTFFLLDEPRRMPEFLVDQFPGPDAALAFARNLLTRSDPYSAVEIVQGETKIATLER